MSPAEVHPFFEGREVTGSLKVTVNVSKHHTIALWRQTRIMGSFSPFLDVMNSNNIVEVKGRRIKSFPQRPPAELNPAGDERRK